MQFYKTPTIYLCQKCFAETHQEDEVAAMCLQCGIVAPGETKSKFMLAVSKARDGDIEEMSQLLLATNMRNLVLPTER